MKDVFVVVKRVKLYAYTRHNIVDDKLQFSSLHNCFRLNIEVHPRMNFQLRVKHHHQGYQKIIEPTKTGYYCKVYNLQKLGFEMNKISGCNGDFQQYKHTINPPSESEIGVFGAPWIFEVVFPQNADVSSVDVYVYSHNILDTSKPFSATRTEPALLFVD